MPSGDTWATLIGYTTTAQLQPITDGVTDADASYMQSNSGSHEKTIIGRLKENAFRNKAAATASDTTPSVANLSIVTIGYTNPITDFDDGLDTQWIEVIATTDGVVINHSSSIKLPLEQNITLNTDDYLFLEYVSTKWVYRGHYNL